MFKGGFSFCMNGISYKRHSNLPLHFLKTVMFHVLTCNVMITVYLIQERNAQRGVPRCTLHLAFPNNHNVFFITYLINRAGGLYGTIFTEVVSTDRTQ